MVDIHFVPGNFTLGKMGKLGAEIGRFGTKMGKLGTKMGKFGREVSRNEMSN